MEQSKFDELMYRIDMAHEVHRSLWYVLPDNEDFKDANKEQLLKIKDHLMEYGLSTSASTKYNIDFKLGCLNNGITDKINSLNEK